MSPDSLNTLRAGYLLHVGDNALILSQRLCAWCGHAPSLEEELALGNIALDLLGQARLWLSAAGRSMAGTPDEDALAYGRDAQDFRNALLLEQPNGNFADTQARQFLFDSWHCLLLRELARGADQEIAAIAAKGLKEASYHLVRSSGWMVRLGDGSAHSHQLCQQALERHWPFVDELFEMGDAERALLSEGIGCDLQALYPEWRAYVEQVLAAATLRWPHGVTGLHGGKRGRHGEALVALLMEMQFLARTHPGAAW